MSSGTRRERTGSPAPRVRSVRPSVPGAIRRRSQRCRLVAWIRKSILMETGPPPLNARRSFGRAGSGRDGSGFSAAVSLGTPLVGRGHVCGGGGGYSLRGQAPLRSGSIQSHCARRDSPASGLDQSSGAAAGTSARPGGQRAAAGDVEWPAVGGRARLWPYYGWPHTGWAYPVSKLAWLRGRQAELRGLNPPGCGCDSHGERAGGGKRLNRRAGSGSGAGCERGASAAG